MSDEHRISWIDSSNAAAYGVDTAHLMEHLAATALCLLSNQVELLDVGLYVQVKDADRRTWTFSVIPEDGGAITSALLEQAQGEDS